MFRRAILGALSVLAIAGVVSGTDFYVSPTGQSDNAGTITDPWNLQHALTLGQGVQPGDTIWLRGGTYSGTFVSYLNGTAASPIVIRQYPGERATLDGGSSAGTAVLAIRGSYTWFWGFEIMSSDPTRQSSQSGSNPSDIHRGDGVQIWQTGNHAGFKFINLVVHDARQGFSFWKEAIDAEINGCLIYYNGWNGADRGHGHGIYTQNNTGTKHIVDNVIFENFDHGIQGYGSSTAHLNNYDIHGNTFSTSGEMASPPGGRNLLIGGDSTAQNLSVANNFLYYQAAESPDSAFQLGYGSGCSGTTVSTNYVSNNTMFAGGCLPTSMTGNTFYGSTSGFSHSSYPNNTYTTTRPSALQVFVRPNAYEAGRANITVFNWPNQSSVSVDLTGVLAPGSGFEVRNAADFLGAPVLTGTYNGGSLVLPMTGLSVATPYGVAAPDPSGPQFNAFVLLPAASGGIPTATRTPSKTPTPTGPTHTPTRTPTRTPTPGGGAGTIRLEAENATLVAPMQIGTSSYAFNGKYISSASSESGSATWTVTVPTTGDYVIWARAIATSDTTDSCYVSRDGGSVDIFDASYGVWSPSWKWSIVNGRLPTGVPASHTPRVFPMTAGTHTIKFKARNANVKYDRIIVTNDMLFVPTEAP